MWHRVWAVALIAGLFAACGGSTTPARPSAKPTASPGFSIAAVIASFTDECKDPFVVDDQFCSQVVLAGMTADGTILNVPTNLDPANTDRATVICKQLAFAHFDSAGKDLGYKTIGILDRTGGHAAACFTSS